MVVSQDMRLLWLLRLCYGGVIILCLLLLANALRMKTNESFTLQYFTWPIQCKTQDALQEIYLTSSHNIKTRMHIGRKKGNN